MTSQVMSLLDHIFSIQYTAIAAWLFEINFVTVIFMMNSFVIIIMTVLCSTMAQGAVQTQNAIVSGELYG